MDGFSEIRFGYLFNFIDFDDSIANKIINTIIIDSSDTENEELKMLYNYLLGVYDTLTGSGELANEGVVLQSKKDVVYNIKYEKNMLYIAMEFIYDMKKKQDIVELKNLITLFNNRNSKKAKNNINLHKNGKLIIFDKNNIDFVSFKKILDDLVDNEFEDDIDFIYTIGHSQGNGEYYLKNLASHKNIIIIGNKIAYNMSEINITKLYDFITFLYSIIIDIDNDNDTIFDNFDIECESTEDPITYQEWNNIPNKYKIPKGKYPDLSQCYELTSLLKSFESNLSTTVYGVPHPIYPFDPYTTIPITSDTLYSLLNIYDEYNNDSPKIYPHLNYLKIMSFLLVDYENIIKKPTLFRQKYLNY